MANDPFKPKPIVDANLITEFGGIEDLPEFHDEGMGQGDYLYVPGASDMRYQRDLDLGRYHRGEIKGKDVSTLEWNARWFRTVKGGGSDPDNIRLIHAVNSDYRAATASDVGTPWLTAMPPGAKLAPDGTIKSAGGDLALYVADKKTAARNAMRKKMRTEASVDGMEFEVGGLGNVGQKIKGADPFVEKTIGTSPTEGAK